MKTRIIALSLAAILLLGLGATALAEEQGEPLDAQAAETGETTPEVPASPAGPDTADAPYVPDAVGVLSFENLERRMRENNLNLLVLQENIAAVEAMDYDKQYEDLRKSLNKIAAGQWGLIQMGQYGSFAYAQLDQAYDAARQRFEDIKDGKLQKNDEGLIRQLKNGQDQAVMGAESLYVALAQLENQERGLQRQLSGLNRTVEEMELRYRLGQVSALQLEQVQAGRTALVSGLETLRMNVGNLKTQLELFIGAELTGKIQLTAVPETAAAGLEAMDLEKDLAAAKDKSYEIYAANKALEDAKEDYKDMGREYGYNESKYQFVAAKHIWQAAQHSHAAAIQAYELKFRTLFDQVKDYKQIAAAAQTALAVEQHTYAAMELKHKQGTVSSNKLLEAEDTLRAAEETAQNAAIDLFSAYNTYCWATAHGILN